MKNESVLRETGADEFEKKTDDSIDEKLDLILSRIDNLIEELNEYKTKQTQQ